MIPFKAIDIAIITMECDVFGLLDLGIKKKATNGRLFNVNGGTEIQWNAERNPPQRFITQFKYSERIVIVKYTITNFQYPR